MPEQTTIFDTLDEEAEAAALARAETEIDAGLGVPQERVREWLLKLAAGERVPPPCA